MRSPLLEKDGIATVLVVLLENDRVSYTQLAELTGLARQKVSRIVDLLEIGAVIEIKKEDKNTKLIMLTDVGKETAKLLDEAFRYYEENKFS